MLQPKDTKKGVAEEQVDVLHAVTAAEIDSEEGAYNLAVLVAEGGTADAQYPVYHIAQKSIEFVQYKIYSAKSGYFRIFVLSLPCQSEFY